MRKKLRNGMRDDAAAPGHFPSEDLRNDVQNATASGANCRPPGGPILDHDDRAGRQARQELDVVGDADDETRAIDEVNTSIYCFRRSLLAPALRRLSPENSQGEYYLTDTVAVLHDAGYPIVSLVVEDPMEAAGVNDRAQLATAEAELRDRTNERWMRRGVTMLDPERTYIDASVQLANDVTLFPGTLLQGSTVVGAGAEIGPDARLVDCVVGERAIVEQTVARQAEIGDDSRVGPFAYLAPGARVVQVDVDPAARTVRVDAGCNWGEVNDALQPHGLAATGGFVSVTGVSGLTLGGAKWNSITWDSTSPHHSSFVAVICHSYFSCTCQSIPEGGT